MKRLVTISIGLVAILGFQSCKNSTDTTPVAFTGAAAFAAVDTALGSAEGMIAAPARMSQMESVMNPLAGGLAAKWEVATSYNNPKYNITECPTTTEPSMITLKDYMGTQFESDEVRCNGSAINIFGRLENAAGIVCIMMNRLSATTSAEMATAADTSFTMDSTTKAALSTACPMMAADLNNETSVPTGTVVSLAFDAPAVSTTYDLKVTIQPFNNTVFLKYGGDEINFANNEDNTNGNQRVLVSYNRTTKVLRAEYVSKAKGSSHFPLYVHRLYMDDTNNEGRILSAIWSGFPAQNNSAAVNKETYIVSGHPSASSIALAIKLESMGLADGEHEACVNGDTGAITTDGPTVTSDSFSCGSTAATGKTISSVTAVGTINTFTAVALPSTWWVLSTGSEALSWTTRDNMLTSGL